MSVRSISTLEELAMSGDMSARYNLGVRHLNGEGVVKDPSEAARHFTLAARAGHAPSQRQLAQMHMRGQAVTQSKVLAHHWLNLASRQDSADGRAARAEMERLEITMSPEQVSEAQALSTHGDNIGR
jgi:TPR repeat protein